MYAKIAFLRELGIPLMAIWMGKMMISEPWFFRVTCQQTNEVWYVGKPQEDHFPKGTHGIVHIFCMSTELLGGIPTPPKNHGVRQLGWLSHLIIMEKNPNVPNRQAVSHVYWSVVGIQTLPWPDLDDFSLSVPCPRCPKIRLRTGIQGHRGTWTRFCSDFPYQGLVNVPHLGAIGHHLWMAIIDEIPHGWVMFSDDI